MIPDMAPKPAGAVPKYATRRSPRRRSRGAEISDTADLLGFPLLPWQFDAVDVATEFRVRDRVPYRKAAVITVPRQSGKSIVAHAIAVDTMRRDPGVYGVITAQTRIAATNRLKHIARTLASSGLDPFHTFTRGVGNERIILSNGSQLDVVSPTATSVHGESVDFAIVDEAWAVDTSFLAGVVPAMVARPRSQLWVISTAGTDDSVLLNDMLAAARADPQGDTAMVEYSMPDGCDIYDESRWGEWMPALGHTTTVASIRAAKSVMSLPEFRRAFGNIATTEANAAAVPYEWWQRSVESPIPEQGLSIAVDVNRPYPGWSIATAWTTDTGYHVDLVAYGQGLELSAIPGKVRDLAERFRASSIGLDAAGPAGSLLPQFQDLAEWVGAPLKLFNGRDRARADVHLLELLRDSRLTHSTSGPLDDAVHEARAGEKGDAWFFSRAETRVDVSPLLASSMAVWCAHEFETLAPVVAIY
jgi:hypothetical protein